MWRNEQHTLICIPWSMDLTCPERMTFPEDVEAFLELCPCDIQANLRKMKLKKVRKYMERMQQPSKEVTHKEEAELHVAVAVQEEDEEEEAAPERQQRKSGIKRRLPKLTSSDAPKKKKAKMLCASSSDTVPRHCLAAHQAQATMQLQASQDMVTNGVGSLKQTWQQVVQRRYKQQSQAERNRYLDGRTSGAIHALSNGNKTV